MITSLEWPADNYAVGSYIQATVSDFYLPQLHIKPSDSVLDIGCGEGAYSLKLLKQFPMASLLGIDCSENMIQLACQRALDLPKLTFKQEDVSFMNYHNQFDYILSFWCLQWVDDLYQAFQNVYNALKENGELFILLPTGDDAFYQTYLRVKASGKFPVLNHFVSPVNYERLKSLKPQIQNIPFGAIDISIQHQQILLPDLETYCKFIYGIPFYNGQIPEEDIKKIQLAMIEAYDEECQLRFHGKYIFDFQMYVVTAKK